MGNINGPFIYTKNTSNRIMKNVLISLIPLVLFAIYKNGFALFFKGQMTFIEAIYPLFFIILCGGSTFLFETLYAVLFYKNKVNIKNYIKSSFSFAPGIILSLIIPINTPIVVILLSCFLSTILGRMIFGGYSKGLFNTVALSFLIISIFSVFNGGYSYLNSYESTKYSNTALGIIQDTNLDTKYDDIVKPFGDLKQFFVGNVPGGIGEVSIILCLISFIYLIIKKATKHLIPITIVITSAILFFITGLLNGLGGWFVLFNLFTGALVFGSIFVASDMFTSPITELGQIIYGILVAMLTVVFRYIIPFGDIFLAIFICNMLVPFIDEMCAKARINK